MGGRGSGRKGREGKKKKRKELKRDWAKRTERKWENEK